jgi:orotate phosphoribosyltransferase
MVANAFTDILATAIGLSEFDYIHGPAYKGIPLAGAIALQLHRDYQANKRWGYDRKEAKDHGDKAEEWLVGELHDEDRVVIVDDVITTGLTKLQNLETLKQHSQKANLECIGIVILLDRQEQDTEGNDPVAVLKDNGIQVYSILEIRDVAVLLNEQNLISEDEYTHMQAYFERYGTHSKTL